MRYISQRESKAIYKRLAEVDAVEIIRHLTVATLLAVRAHSRNAAIPVRDDPLAAALRGARRLALKFATNTFYKPGGGDPSGGAASSWGNYARRRRGVGKSLASARTFP